MDRELYQKIDVDVERFRKALVYYARASEWEIFENKAGSLFDYLEAIELTVLERKFMRIFRLILGILIVAVIIVMKLDSGIFPSLIQYKGAFALVTIAGACYELYFYLDFQIYVKAKMSWYKKRRERFIRNIEDDFRSLVVRSENETEGVPVYER